MTLVDHKSDLSQPIAPGQVNLMEDTKDLVRIDGSQGQVIVGIAAVIEVKTSEHVDMQKPRHDLLDVLCGVVMPGIHEDARPWPGTLGKMHGHAPIGDVGMVEG